MPGKLNTNKPMRDRPANDWYETPYPLAEFACNLLEDNYSNYLYAHNPNILDPGPGTGVWGKAARKVWPASYIVGQEIDTSFPNHPDYDLWLSGDFTSHMDWDHRFDFVIGNPPYRLAEEFVRRGLGLLQETGILLYLLKLDFLAGVKRMKGLYSENSPLTVYVCATRPSFTGDGRANAYEYGLFVWRKANGPRRGDSTVIQWCDWKNNIVLP